jgi:P27 family predicted phage terminase small subunit
MVAGTGRPPKPTALKLLHGETRPSRVNPNEARPRDALPVPPEWLSDEVRAVWDRVVDELRHMRVVSAADTDALVVYCQAVVHHREAAELVNREGLLLAGRDGGWVKHPAMQFVRDQAVLIKVMAGQFGLTPAARVGLSTGDAPDVEGAARLLS